LLQRSIVDTMSLEAKRNRPSGVSNSLPEAVKNESMSAF